MLFRRPTVSVIIPSYNHENFVEAAIRSVLNQSLSDMEVIVVDDGSSDATPDKIAAIKDERIKLVRMPDNRLIHPRNLALQMAKGRYIAFQNSDDIWLPGKLKIQVGKLQTDKKIIASFTGVELIDKSGKKVSDSWLEGIFTTNELTSHQWQRRFFDLGNCLCISSAVVRRSAFKKAGLFKPSLVQLSDLDLWVRLAALGDFKIYKTKYTKMRVSKNNLSYPSPQAVKRSNWEFTEVLKRYLKAPLIDNVPSVFEDEAANQPDEIAVKLVTLANHAISVGTPAHRRFADFTLAKILDDPKLRQSGTKVFGRQIIADFIDNRGKMEIIVE